MTDDQLNASIDNLPPPRFDDSATAKAQPVEPISQSRFAKWFGKGGAVRGLITTKFGALALVVIAGLAAGTFGGMALVSHSQRSVQADGSRTNESVSILPKTKDQFDFEVAEIGARGLLVTGAAVSRRNIRARERRGGVQRAYRVAVIH